MHCSFYFTPLKANICSDIMVILRNIYIEGEVMRILAKPVDMVCWFEKTGVPHPIKFRITAEDESEVVMKVNKVISIDKERLAGNDMLLFKCQSNIRNQQRLFELKYEIRTCKWILWKM